MGKITARDRRRRHLTEVNVLFCLQCGRVRLGQLDEVFYHFCVTCEKQTFAQTRDYFEEQGEGVLDRLRVSNGRKVLTEDQWNFLYSRVGEIEIEMHPPRAFHKPES